MNQKEDSFANHTSQAMGLFPTPIWKHRWECPKLLNELETTIYQLREEDAGVSKSNRGGWHSSSRLFYAESGPMQKIAKQFLEEVRKINSKLELDGGWANINPPGTSNGRHIHPKCVLAGVFYVRATRDSGSIKLHDPRDVSRMMGGLPDYVSQSVTVAPEPGMLLLFPAWLPHEVTENTSGEDRISIAFNAFERWQND